MSIDTLISGRLKGAATIKTASNGNTYALFKVSASDKDGNSVLVSCITFSKTCMAAVELLEDGDSIAVSGEASISTWQGRDGGAQHGLNVTAHLIQSAYHVGRKRGDKPTQASPQGGEDLGDWAP
jgi:single-stranded DNA-binding protein